MIAAGPSSSETATAEGPVREAIDGPSVLHVVSSDAFAGIERHAVRLAGALRTLDCAAQLACPRSAQRMREEAAMLGVPVCPAAAAGGPWGLEVLRAARVRRPDLIHVHDGRAALLGAGLATATGAMLVRTQHFTRPASDARSGWAREASLGLHRLINRRAAGYIAVSRSVADSARRRSEVLSAAMAVVAPGIALASDEAVARARELRRTLDRPVVAYIGRLEAESRLEDLVAAVGLIRPHRPQARFVIAGAGQTRARLEALAQREGVAAAIEWRGWVPEPDDVLAAAHVYVNTRPWEGFGMAMAEAMAYALPVVATRSGASAELVQDGVTGQLYPPGDVPALAEAILGLLADRARAEAMGEAGRAVAVERLSVESTARETLAFYRRLLGR